MMEIQFLIIKNMEKLRQQAERNSNFRASSPIRSPKRCQQRQQSPFRTSPYSRPGPMSPLRMRRQEKGMATPTRGRICLQEDNDRSPLKIQPKISIVETQAMQKTIKSGIGLFQKLASQKKIGSQKKQNLKNYPQVNPFELVQKNKTKFDQYNHNACPTAQTIQMIQKKHSLNLSQNNGMIASEKTSKNQVKVASGKTKIQSTVKLQYNQILDSFGAPKYSQVVQNSVFSRLISKASEEVPSSTVKSKCVQNEKQFQIQEQQVAVCSSFDQKNPQVSSSYEEIMLLIRKAGQKVGQDEVSGQINVKSSFGDSKLSFNMRPYL